MTTPTYDHSLAAASTPQDTAADTANTRHAAADAVVSTARTLSPEAAADAISAAAAKLSEEDQDAVYAAIVTQLPVPQVIAIAAASQDHPASVRGIAVAARKSGSPELGDSLLTLFADMLWKPTGNPTRIGRQVWETRDEVVRRLDTSDRDATAKAMVRQIVEDAANGLPELIRQGTEAERKAHAAHEKSSDARRDAARLAEQRESSRQSAEVQLAASQARRLTA